MPSLLRRVLESCQSGLPNRSSINPLPVVPQCLSESPSCVLEDSAVSESDETDHHNITTTPVGSLTEFVVPVLSPISEAHILDYVSEITFPRHHNTLRMIATCDASSPTSTLPHTALASCKPSFTALVGEGKPEQVNLERLHWRLASGFFAYFVCGWGDGVTGTVLPYFKAQFHINFMLLSLLYVGSTIGFLIGTLLVESIINQLGRFSPTNGRWSWFPRIPGSLSSQKPQKPQEVIGYSPSQARLLALLLSSCLHGMFFIMMALKGGYWVLFCAYTLSAFARSILTAALNAYFASGPKQSLGYAFGLWSLGGVASPLACQAIIAIGIPWSHFYLGSLVLSALNVACLVITFRPTATEFLRDQENALIVVDQLADASPTETMTPISKLELETGGMNNEGKRQSTLRRALSFPYQWAMSLFLFIYCGCETTTQTFMVTYLLGTRHANPNTIGYVTSGFWGGITIGRLLWGHYTAKLTYTQRKYVIQGCIPNDLLVVGLIMQLLIWFINSNIQNAICSSIIGLVYGPVYPASFMLANDILPPDIEMVSMAFLSAIASIGTALFPFAAGLISSIKGIHTLTFVTVPLASAVVCLWFLFPSNIPHHTTIV